MTTDLFESPDAPADEPGSAFEIRTALAVALGYAQLLQRRLTDPVTDPAALLQTSEQIVAYLGRLELLHVQEFGDGTVTEPADADADMA